MAATSGQKEKVRKKMKDEKKGSPTAKQNNPRIKAEAKNLLKDKRAGTENQEQMLLEFMDSQPQDKVTLEKLEMVWAFIFWLNEKGCSIVHDDDLLTAPFSKFAKLKDLK